MSCHRFASLCLLAGVLPACASPRAAAPIAPVQAAVDSVFTRYYRAIGGLDRVLAVTSRRMWGTYVEGALSAHTYAEGFDGRTWEYNFQMRRLVVDSGVAADAGRRGAEFDESGKRDGQVAQHAAVGQRSHQRRGGCPSARPTGHTIGPGVTASWASVREVMPAAGGENSETPAYPWSTAGAGWPNTWRSAPRSR